MTVPTQKQFAEWLSIANGPMEFRTPRPDSSIVDERFLVSIFKERIDLCNARAEQLEVTATGCWLNQTREISKAHQRVFRKTQKTHVEHRCIAPEQRAKEIVNQASTVEPGPNAASRYVEKTLDSWTKSPWSGSWVEELVQAMAEYFDVEKPQRMIEAYRQAEPAIAEARRAMLKLIKVEETLSALLLPRYRAPRGMGHLSRLVTDEDSVFAFRLGETPIKRKDARNSERLFVFRMYKTNMRHVRSPRIEAIDELMSIDGFRHQYDRRTIERLCAEFTGKKRAPSQQLVPGQ